MNLSTRLGLHQDVLQWYLKELESRGLIENRNDKWVYKAGEFHVPKNSPLAVLHNQNWRSRAIQDSQNFRNESIHYTNIQAVSSVDCNRIKELMLQFISEASQIAGPSTPEDAVAITCDFFRI